MKNNDEHLHIKISEDLKKQLEEEAYKKGFTVSMYVRILLIEALKKE